MNSSPVDSWDQLTSKSSDAIYTFADSPWVIAGICFAVLVTVGWFLIAAFRMEDRDP